ncbi:unnamed protein product [Sphagnum compactum]
MRPRSSRLGVEGIKSFNAKEESHHRETPQEHVVFSSTAAASDQQNNPATSNVNQLKLRAAASPPDAAGRASPEDMSTTHRRTLSSRAFSTRNTSCSSSEIPHDSSRQQAGSSLTAGTSSSTNLAKHDQLEDDDSARESDPSAQSTRRDQFESTHEAAAAAAAYHMKFSIPELYLGAPLENLLEEEEESGGARKTTWQTERKLSSDHAGATVLKSRVQSAGELLLHNNNPRLSASSWSHHHQQQQQQRSTVSDHDVGAASSYQQRTRPRSVSALEAAAADHSSPRHVHGLINNNRSNYTNPPSSGSGSAAGLHDHWSCISGPSFLQGKELLWRRRQQLPTIESPASSSSRAHHDPSPRAMSVKEPAGNRARITQWAGSNNNSLLQSISTAARRDSARTMMMFDEQLSAEMDQTQGHNHTASSSSPTPMCGSRPVDATTLQRKASTPTTTIPQMDNIMMPIEGLKFVPTLVQSSSRSQQPLVGTSSVATHSGDQAAAGATVRLRPRSWDSSKLLPQLQKHGNSLYNNNNPIPVANSKPAAAASSSSSSSIQKSQSLRYDYGAGPLDDIFAAGRPHSSSSNSKFAMDSAGIFTSFRLRGKKKQNFSFDADDADVLIPRVGPRAALVQKAMSMRAGGAHSDAITEMAHEASLNSQQAYSSNWDQLISTHAGEAQQRLLECAMCGKELGVMLVQSGQNHVQQDMMMGMSFCHTCRPPPSIGFQSLRHDPTASDSHEDPTAAPAALRLMMKNKNKTNKHNKNNKGLILQFCRKMLGLDKKQK